ncbi:hypothetical protein ACHAXT_010319 [Thalassiosira profunda]
MKIQPLLLAAAAAAAPVEAFQSGCATRHIISSLRAEEQWSGEVVNDADGRIRGCTITTISETEFEIQIDGNEADLGNFGNVVYRKITADAKRQSFQGFRPGTIPPHLLPTYKGFAMDEVAREAVLEAMQQNNIRPFDSCRTEMEFEAVSIPPKPKKKRKKSRKRKTTAEAPTEEEAPPAWETYDTMKEALKGGWEPGQSFSFVAKNCKGQKVKEVETERPPVI